MNKIYRSTMHIHAAQLMAIALPSPAPEGEKAQEPHLVLIVDGGEQFHMPAAWVAENKVQVGGYIGTYGGVHMPVQVIFVPAEAFASDFEHVANAEDFEPKAVEPAPQTTYTFDQFVEYGIAAGGNLVEGMPWSFTFHGRPVSHENNDRYLITTKEGKMLDLNRGETLHIDADGSLWVEGA